MEIEQVYKTEVIGLAQYIQKNTSDIYCQMVSNLDACRTTFSLQKLKTKFQNEMNLDEQTIHDSDQTNLTATEHAKRERVKYKQATIEHRKDQWASKSLHGQHRLLVSQSQIDEELSYNWLKSSDLKPETEGFLIAAQDQALRTKYYSKKILGQDCDGKCRMCHVCNETVDHLMSGCPVLAANDYTWRHDRIGKYIHLQLCKHFGIETPTNKWYQYEPPQVVESEEVTILWDVPITTDREINCNRPDIVVKKKSTKSCLFIDFAVPCDRNVSLKEREKLDKYRDLKLEVERMWHTKVDIVPVVVGATGLAKRGVLKHIEKIPGHVSFDMIQKIALLDTAHILRKCLNESY